VLVLLLLLVLLGVPWLILWRERGSEQLQQAPLVEGRGLQHITSTPHQLTIQSLKSP